MDPFATLGIDRTYEVDLRALERTHRELSRALHPDRFVQSPAGERKAALEKAVDVNEAWRIVRDPIRRAEALLGLAGIPVGEDREPKADPEFLMEMLELRESLAEAKAEKNVARVREMAKAIEARSGDAQASLRAGFASRDASVLPSLTAKLGELRFYRRFLDEVSAIEDELAA